MRSLVAVFLLALPGVAVAAERVGPPADQWNQTVDKAVAYLKQSQDQAGSWSGNKSPGVTGVVLTGVLECGRGDEAMTVSALKYIESLINPKAKHIAGADPKIGLQ